MPLNDFSNPLRPKLARGDACKGLWVTLESATVTELASELGMDWVTIDMEHGCLDYKDVVQHIRAARGSDLSVLVRVPSIAIDQIKRVLDLGADGVLLPLVRTADDLELGMQYGRYPGRGVRGIGGERSLRCGLKLQEYLAMANNECMIIPLIETGEAVDNIDAILNVEGLETIFVGPADLSSSRGHLGEWEGGNVAQEILTVLEKAGKKGISSGIMAMDNADLMARLEQGFSMIGLGSDVGMMTRTLRPMLAELGGRKFEKRWF